MVLGFVVTSALDYAERRHPVPSSTPASKSGLRLNTIPAVSVSAPLDERLYQSLLNRPQVQLDQERLATYYRGKRVLITGAGGSIGSEIAQQVLFLGASQITLVENSELALYNIHYKLKREKTATQINAVLCDVTRRERLLNVIKREDPEIIFHAAALKHVPMVELNPSEGVLTNVFGTRNVIDAANACQVGQLVLISSDKAVAPSSIMGATKRLAEYLIRHNCGKIHDKTHACVVRFGNVLGSTGSVIPLFRTQIEHGGPLTLTDPNVERFFMTIFEAVQLVLQAAVENQRSIQPTPNLYVLEMGKPIKIIDLAHRVLGLYGLKPGVDIDIEYIGLRDGEKLTEDLIDFDEAQSLLMPGIYEIKSQNNSFVIDDGDLSGLFDIATKSEDDLVRSVLFSYVNRIHRAASLTQTDTASVQSQKADQVDRAQFPIK
jgi:FlaA1/EpsC-like NDP-sugar epimerase